MESKPSEHTLVQGDVNYLEFYLSWKDPITGSISPYDLSKVDSIIFTMREYRSTVNAIEVPMEIVDRKTGYIRVLATIPSAGLYYSQIEVSEIPQTITFIGPRYRVIEQMR